MEKNFNMLPNDDIVHSLLEPPMPAYSSTTVRRAFIVWLQLGQQPEFKQVCNFYHQLEEKERAMTPEDRIKSRSRELRMYYKLPAIVDFNQRKISAANMRQIREITSEVCVFQLEGFCELRADKHLKTKDVLKISKVIRDYCKSHSKSLRNLYLDFEDFTKKTDSKKSFNVITGYIKNKFIKDELELFIRMQRIIECQLSFLNDDFDIKYKMKKELAKKTEVNKSSALKNVSHSPVYDVGRDVIKFPNAVRLLASDPRRNDILIHTPESKKDGSNNNKW